MFERNKIPLEVKILGVATYIQTSSVLFLQYMNFQLSFNDGEVNKIIIIITFSFSKSSLQE